MPLLATALILGSAVLHAGWNLLAHAHRRHPFLFVQMCLWTTGLGIVPIGLMLWHGNALPAAIWGYAAISGACLSVYFLGLGQGYRAGDFTLVYPLARAAPILLLVGFDLARGHALEAGGYVGVFMVVGGCLLLAGNGRSPVAGAVTGRTLGWVAVIALGTAGYTSVDKLAMERVAEGDWLLAAQYGWAQFSLALPGLWLALVWMNRRRPVAADRPAAGSVHRVALAVAAINLASYVLLLLAYQLVDQASYVLAMRQASIVLGAALGVWLLSEPAPRRRLGAATLIGAGVGTIILTLTP